MLIALKFSVPPWQWREHADDRDWGTAIRILQAEADRYEEVTHGS